MRKKSKDRLTVLIAENVNGSVKLTSLDMGKFLKSCCLKNCKSLPVPYDANWMVWMAISIWGKKNRRLDKFETDRKRTVVIIADNCVDHWMISNLNLIGLVFLLSDCTSVAQSLDQRIIQNSKINIRKLLLKDFIAPIYQNRKFHLSVLDAMCYIFRSWNIISKKTT